MHGAKRRDLVIIAGSLLALLAANAHDVEKAKAAGLSAAMIDRLTLNSKRLVAMADGIRQVAELPDPDHDPFSGGSNSMPRTFSSSMKSRSSGGRQF